MIEGFREGVIATMLTLEEWARGMVSRRPRWLPPVVDPMSHSASVELQALRFETRAAVEADFASMLQAMLGAGELSHGAMLEKIHAAADELTALLNSGDADSIANHLAQNYAVANATFQMQRQIAGTWSAIIAPSVAMRAHKQQLIDPERLMSMACEWVDVGTTPDARLCMKSSRTRVFASHPARMYELLMDQGTAFGVPPANVMASLVRPVIQALMGAVVLTQLVDQFKPLPASVTG